MSTQVTSEKLPQSIEEALTRIITAAKESFKDNLVSLVLFGSGAEGRLRATSDVNLLFVLKCFEKTQMDTFREPLQVARIANRVAPMFLLESELADAAEAFAVKFDDIGRRHRLLFGRDVTSEILPSREARIRRLNQVLLNLILRLRERYTAVSVREETLALLLAESAGPLRSAASTLLELEGNPAENPRKALATIAESRQGTAHALLQISKARDMGTLPSGEAVPALFQLIALAEVMRQRLSTLK